MGVFDGEKCAEIMTENCGGSQTWFYLVHCSSGNGIYAFR